MTIVNQNYLTLVPHMYRLQNVTTVFNQQTIIHLHLNN